MRTVGVEEEFLLVEEASGTVSPLAERLFRTAEGIETPDGEPVAVAEFKSEQAELGSVPCEQLGDLHADLVGRRLRVREAARRAGAAVAAMATSPVSLRSSTSPEQRYEKMTADFGLVARQQLTCGTHVHVSISSRAEGVAVIDRIRPWLPVLTALSANSPFWDGEDSDYSSYRTVVWGQWPTAGPIEAFGDEAGYDRAVAELLASGTMRDSGMVYFDARLSTHYPTVEIRVADACTDVADSVLIGGLCRALVDTAATDAAAGSTSPDLRVALLRAASWRAARSGMSGDLVDVAVPTPVPAWTMAENLLSHLESALRTNGDWERVTATIDGLREHGTGADRQRQAFAARESLDDVLTDVIARTNS